MYLTPAGSPDRYASQAATVRQQMLQTDTIFAESAQMNGGSSRQVRWVHDASCQPVVQRLTIPAIVDPDGTIHRVDGPNNDTVNTLAAAGYKMDDWNRKYLLFVDYTAKPFIWEDPVCGVAAGLSNDSRPDLSNPNNQGRTLARVDTQCWEGGSEDGILPDHSVVAHEIAHTLGAVLPGAPNSTRSGHCSDNGDLMCYASLTGYDMQGNPTYDAVMRSVCPAAHEPLLDCNGDDYYSTRTAAWVPGQWLSPASATPNAGRWNIANSSFLHTPAAPTATLRATAGFNPGIPAPLSATINVPSGQGWHIDYAIDQAIGSPAACSLTRTTALSSDPAAAGTSLLCNVSTTSASVKATVTSEDGLSGVHILKLTPDQGSLRFATTNLTASANPIRSGSPLTLTARMTDDRTGLPVVGHRVHFLSRNTDGTRSQLVDAVTDSSGSARAPVTVEASTRYIAATDWSHAWASTSAALDVVVEDPTALTLTAALSYVDPGTDVNLSGRLTTDPDEPLLFRSVELWRFADGSWTQLDTLVSNEDGIVEAKVGVTADASYQLRFAGVGSYTKAESPAVAISVRRATTSSATMDQTAVNTGGKITVTGAVSTASGPVTGLPVGLWSRSGTAWTKVSAADTSVDGTVSFTTTPRSSGSYQLRFAASERLLGSATAELPFTVRAPVTLTATIPTSAPYGSQLDISAVVRTGDSPLPGRAVQLWRVSFVGDTLVSTSAPTDANGIARFQAPADGNRTYQVRVPADARYEAAVSAQIETVAVRRTALTGTLADAEVSYGDTVAISASLASTSVGAEGSLAGADVELWATPADGAAGRVATTKTSSTGGATFTVAPTATSTYRVKFLGTYDAARSDADLGTVTVTRSALSTLSVPATLAYGGSTTITGRVTWSGASPAPVRAATVELWAAADGSTPTLAGIATTNTSGQVSFDVSPTATTSYQLRHPGGGDGPWQLITAPPTPPQTLTVIRSTVATVSAPAEVAYNAKATVTGRVSWSASTTGVPSQPVELWAQPAGKSWNTFAAATTDSTGRVSFSVTAGTTTVYQLRYPGGPAGAVTAAAATSSTATVVAVRATSATVKLSTTRLTYGSKVAVSSTLRWTGTSTGMTSQPVELWGKARGSWRKVGSATTSSTGAATFSVTPSFTTAYQLRFATRTVGSVTAKAATSNSLTTRVVAKVSLTAPAKASSRSTVTITGTVTPAIAGRTVSIVANGKALTKVTTTSSGKFSAKVKIPKGKVSLYASVPTTADNDGARSSTRRVSAS